MNILVKSTVSSLPTRQFGRTDMKITRVGFGAWALGGPDGAVGWGAQPANRMMRTSNLPHDGAPPKLAQVTSILSSTV